MAAVGLIVLGAFLLAVAWDGCDFLRDAFDDKRFGEGPRRMP